MLSGLGLLLLHFRSARLNSSILIVELYGASLCCGRWFMTDEFLTSLLYLRKDSMWFWLLLFVWNRSAKVWAMSRLVLIYSSLYFIILGIELNLIPLFLLMNLDSALAFLHAMWSNRDFVFFVIFNILCMWDSTTVQS